MLSRQFVALVCRRIRVPVQNSLPLLALLFVICGCLQLETHRLAAAQEDTASDVKRRPNIVIVYTDDQGYGDASCLNPEAKFQTPNMDRLAAQGISFTDAHCSASVCTPSRYGLLTGRYAWRTTLKRGVFGAEKKGLISDDRETLASFLRQSGYATCMVGKWHLGMDFPGKNSQDRDWTQPVRDMPLDKGFDYFYGIPASLNYGILAWFEGRFAKTPPTMFTNKKPNRRHVDYRIRPPYEATPEATAEQLGKRGWEIAEDFVDNQCLTRFTDKAIDWISEHRAANPDQPFFVYLPYTSPHYPVCPLPKFRGQGDAGAYGEFVIETDYHLGRILDHLDEQDLADDTLIVFTSDNGPEKSWKARVDEFGHRSNGPFREGKRAVYEGGHRVPFFVRWPAGIQGSSRTSDQLLCQTDIFATVAELVGEPLPVGAAEDSISFANALTSSEPSGREEPVIHHAVNGRFAIRLQDWKLVMSYGDSVEELYNIRLDPSESNDVFGENVEVANQLRSAITDTVLSGRTRSGPRTFNDTPYWNDLTWIEETEYEQAQAKPVEITHETPE